LHRNVYYRSVDAGKRRPDSRERYSTSGDLGRARTDSVKKKRSEGFRRKRHSKSGGAKTSSRIKIHQHQIEREHPTLGEWFERGRPLRDGRERIAKEHFQKKEGRLMAKRSGGRVRKGEGSLA